MPTYDPLRHYPSHEQDNPYFVQQHGYLERPATETMVGIAVAVARESKRKLDAMCDNFAGTEKRPLKLPLLRYIKNFKYNKTIIQCIKCGPSYFPVG